MLDAATVSGLWNTLKVDTQKQLSNWEFIFSSDRSRSTMLQFSALNFLNKRRFIVFKEHLIDRKVLV